MPKEPPRRISFVDEWLVTGVCVCVFVSCPRSSAMLEVTPSSLACRTVAQGGSARPELSHIKL